MIKNRPNGKVRHCAVTAALGNGYERLVSTATGASVWNSTSVSDPLWDDFLRDSRCGQIQQTSLWAQYKAAEGWNHHRVVVTRGPVIVGGFQILWTRMRFGRLGYVSKGPVASPDIPELVDELALLLRRQARQLGLTALVVQQPDFAASRIEPGTGGFVAGNPMRVIEATYLVDPRVGIEALRRNMSASLRRNVRKGRKNGTSIRDGSAADLPHFFDLMAETCRRQGVSPNPPGVPALERLWRILAPSNSIRLTLAECEGAVPAAKLSLVFGNVITVWKKGWDGTHNDWHPNELLEDEALEWAVANDMRAVDFCSFDVNAARRHAAGESLAGEELNSRDAYHLRFGGAPQLLPPPLVLLPSSTLRWGYRHSYGRLEHRRQKSRA